MFITIRAGVLDVTSIDTYFTERLAVEVTCADLLSATHVQCGSATVEGSAASMRALVSSKTRVFS